MHSAALVLSIATLVANAIPALLGAWAHHRYEVPRLFWATVRLGQAWAIAQAAFAGVAFVSGADPDDGLYWLYAVLPVAVGLFAEQLRALAAANELERRSLPDAQAVGRLPEAEQQRLVRAIVMREVVVMAIAAAVVVFLALRAATTF